MNEFMVKIGKASGVVFFGKVLEAILLLLFNILAVRLLSPSSYGEFIYVFSFLQIIAMFLRLGLDRGVIAFIPKWENEKNFKKVNQFVSFTILITSTLTFLFIILISIYSEEISRLVLNSVDLYPLLFLLTPILFFLNFMNISVGLFRGLERVNLYIVSKNIIIPILMISLLVISSVSNKFEDTDSLIISHTMAWGLGSLYLIYNLIKNKNLIFPRLKDSDIKDLLKFSFPLLFSTFMGFMIIKLDSLMIGYLLDDIQVGIYNIAFQIAMMSGFVLTSFNTIFAPKISLLYSQGRYKELGSSYKIITKWVMLINIIFFCLIALLSTEIMEVFGTEFTTGAWALLLLTLGQVIKSSVGPVGEMLVLTMSPKYEFHTIFWGTILNVALNFLLIPTFGINGAAFTSFITFGAINIVQFLLLYKRYRIHPFNKEYFKIVTIPLLILLPIYIFKTYVSFNFIVELFIYSIIYVTLLIYFLYILVFNKSEKDMTLLLLKAIKTKVLIFKKQQ